MGILKVYPIRTKVAILTENDRGVLIGFITKINIEDNNSVSYEVHYYKDGTRYAYWLWEYQFKPIDTCQKQVIGWIHELS